MRTFMARWVARLVWLLDNLANWLDSDENQEVTEELYNALVRHEREDTDG